MINTKYGNLEPIDKFAVENHHGNFQYKDKRNRQKFGQAATPMVLVSFIAESTASLINNLFDQYPNQYFPRFPLGADNVRIIEPSVGTGRFMDYLLRFCLTEQQVRDKWDSGYLQCFELCPDVALICAVNMELAYMAITGEYRRCRFVACVDSFDIDPETGSYHCQQDNKDYTENEMWHAFSV